MNVIWAVKKGPPEVLTMRSEPDPTPRTGEVRIRVESIGVNFMDVLGRIGMAVRGLQAPFVPGLEVAGIVDMVAPGVVGFKEGEAVLAYTRGGAYAEFVCVPHRQVFPRFPWMDDVDGASLAIDYLTAFVCLSVLGSLRGDDTVLIHGAHNSIGVAAIHVARIMDAQTIGTAPAQHHEILKEQGLAHAIDPFTTDYQVAVRDLTKGVGAALIMNPYLDIHWRMNYQLLAPAGRLVNYVGASALGQEPAPWRQRLMALVGAPAYTPARLQLDNRSVAGMNLDLFWQPGAKVSRWMESILDWYDQALFRPLIARTFRLDQAGEAHAFIEGERGVGKVLLKP